MNDVAETDGANNIQPENTKEERTIGEVLLSQSKEEALNAKLKLVPAIFSQFFIFSLNDSLSKIWKIFFISSKKLFLY